MNYAEDSQYEDNYESKLGDKANASISSGLRGVTSTSTLVNSSGNSSASGSHVTSNAHHNSGSTSPNKHSNRKGSKKSNGQVVIDIDFPVNWQSKPTSRDRVFFSRDFEGAELRNGALYLPNENETYAPDGKIFFLFSSFCFSSIIWTNKITFIFCQSLLESPIMWAGFWSLSSVTRRLWPVLMMGI